MVVRYIMFWVTFIFSSILLILLNALLHLHVDMGQYINQTVVPAAIVIYTLLILPSALDVFKQRFVLVHSVSKTIFIPMIAVVVVELVSTFIQFSPLLFHGSVIHPAKGQYIDQFHLPGFLQVLMTGPFTAFNEESFFRFMPYIIPLFFLRELAHMLGKFPRSMMAKNLYSFTNGFYQRLYIEERPLFVWGWILITGTLFSLAHLPDFTNFYAYFFSGVLFGFLFFRYGLFSSMLAHLTTNMISGLIFQVMLWLFAGYIK